MIDKPDLGGQEVNIRGAGARPVYSQQSVSVSGGSSTDVTGIVKGITSLIGNYTNYQARKKEKQNAEDVMYAKQSAQDDITSAETAIKTGQSDRQDLNEYVTTLRQDGLTDVEVSAKVYDKLLEEASSEIGNEVLDADKTYLSLVGSARTKSNAGYATQLQKDLQTETVNSIYATSSVRGDEQTYSDVVNQNVEVASTYNIDKQQVYNATIKRAFDLAKRGDSSMLEDLESISHNGVKLIDTIEGSELYTKYSRELQSKQEFDYKLEQRQVAQIQEDNTNMFFGELYREDRDVINVREEALTSFNKGELSLIQFQAIDRVYQTSLDIDQFAKVSDSSTFTTLYGKAFTGTLSQEDLQANQPNLSEADYKAVAKLALEKGGWEGYGDTQYKSLVERVDNDSKSYSGLDFEGKIVEGLADPQIANKRFGYVKQQLTNRVDNFVKSYRKLPTDEQYENMRKEVVAESKALIQPSSITGSTDIDSILKKRNEYTDEASFIKELTESQLEAYREYSINRSK